MTGNYVRRLLRCGLRSAVTDMFFILLVRNLTDMKFWKHQFLFWKRVSIQTLLSCLSWHDVGCSAHGVLWCSSEHFHSVSSRTPMITAKETHTTYTARAPCRLKKKKCQGKIRLLNEIYILIIIASVQIWQFLWEYFVSLEYVDTGWEEVSISRHLKVCHTQWTGSFLCNSSLRSAHFASKIWYNFLIKRKIRWTVFKKGK